MRNGEVKHSDKLVDKDLQCERDYAESMKSFIATTIPRTLADLQAKPGYYVKVKTKGASFAALKGPYAAPDAAMNAYREWRLEAKH